MELDPESLTPAERYGLLISVIAPRPIAWVSTLGEDGSHNLAPFSFFTGIAARPMSVCFAPVRDREGRKKDTLVNVEATGQFVVNLATEANIEAVNATSAELPYGASEFEAAGLTPAPSRKVKAPRVLESPVSLECESLQIVTLSEGPLGGSLVIGKVVHAHVDDAAWKDGRVDRRALKLVGRMEGAWYARTSDVFELSRPKRPVPGRNA